MSAVAPIHVYRPQRTEAEDLEAIFVGREPLVKDILESLGRWKPNGSREHYLLIGPRGIGKTCVLQILAHRIRTGPLADSWTPVALAEEGYGILRGVADLLLQAMEVLVQETGDKPTEKAFRALASDDDDERVCDLGLDALRRYHRETGRRLLIMIENVHRLFDRKFSRDRQSHLLRKILIEEDWLVLIATSPTFVKAVADEREPLFQFFHTKLISELTLAEQMLMLHKLARREQNTDAETFLTKYRSRVQALYHFTGGNPRLTVMLYHLIAHQKVMDVQTELVSLLDQLTPFYQDRMRDLASQEAAVIERMALLPEGCTPTELGAEARMEAKTVRALLTRLERAGYVRREKRAKKQTVYIIPERFFRIWHQMNHSRRVRGQVQYLLEFFSTWYATRDERDEVWDDLTGRFRNGLGAGDDEEAEDAAAYMEYIAAVSEGNEKFQRQFHALRLLLERKGRSAVYERLAEMDAEFGDDLNYHLERGYFCADAMKDNAEALASFDKAIEPMLCLVDDTDSAVRRSAVSAVARLITIHPRRMRPEIVRTVLKHFYSNLVRQAYVAFQFLRSAFCTGRASLVRDVLEETERHFEDAEARFLPHRIALEYLESGRDEVVLVRQHPEVREAVRLLLDDFDAGAAKQNKDEDAEADTPGTSEAAGARGVARQLRRKSAAKKTPRRAYNGGVIR